MSKEYVVRLRKTDGHPNQERIVSSTHKRIICKGGRRGGKTVGVATRAVDRFLSGRRQLYAAPTTTQTDAFWFEIMRSLAEPIVAKVFKVNESERYVELPGTKQCIKAKTAWNAQTLRGDYADDLYLDEFQLMAEDTWGEIGAPMLMDNNGDAVFCYTPPSLASSGISKAKDPRHATKLFNLAKLDKSGMWETIHITSHDNPFISKEGLLNVTRDMSLDSYRREILAEDDEIERSWLVYSAFNEVVCKINSVNIQPNWPVYVGHDFGQANPAAIFVAQDPATGYFYIFNEYLPGAGKSTAQHVEAFKRIVCLPGGKENPLTYNVVKRIGGNATTEDEVRQGYTAHGWPIIAPNIVKPKNQIDRVIGLMERNKIFVLNHLTLLLSELSNCMWELDENNKPTDKIKNEPKYHLLACMRYLFSDFTPETETASNPFVIISV